jgi:hypothetical protein
MASTPNEAHNELIKKNSIRVKKKCNEKWQVTYTMIKMCYKLYNYRFLHNKKFRLKIFEIAKQCIECHHRKRANLFLVCWSCCISLVGSASDGNTKKPLVLTLTLRTQLVSYVTCQCLLCDKTPVFPLSTNWNQANNFVFITRFLNPFIKSHNNNVGMLLS